MTLFGECVRTMAALLAAPAACATIFVAVDLGFLVLAGQADSAGFAFETVRFVGSICFIVAFVHAAVLGLPAYLVLRWCGWTRWWTSLIGGFVIGTLPYGILAIPWRAPDSRLLAAHIIPVFSVPHYLGALAGLGALGMAGGLAAWLTWFWLGRVFAKPRAVPAPLP